MRFLTWVLRRLMRTRTVPTPLYRLSVLAWLLSGLTQLVVGPPTSVQSQGPAWFDYVFTWLQIAGSVLLLVGLYMVGNYTTDAYKLHRSLTLELLGLIMIQTVIALQITAAIYYQERIPSSGPTWMAAVFCLWAFSRDRDIVCAMRILGRPSKEET